MIILPPVLRPGLTLPVLVGGVVAEGVMVSLEGGAPWATLTVMGESTGCLNKSV